MVLIGMREILVDETERNKSVGKDTEKKKWKKENRKNLSLKGNPFSSDGFNQKKKKKGSNETEAGTWKRKEAIEWRKNSSSRFLSFREATRLPIGMP